ncbi:MAG: YXWGXW repeat-containing protein [candidate division Zixibacteria bacterium]|nr:YXWGXW repeat-containing protein [candidate division Zixibacteria bacterium]
MKQKLFVFGVFVLLLAFSYGYAETIYVIKAPPALKVDVKPSAPSVTAVWIDGHWKWNGQEFVWVGGHWEKNPKGIWKAGHWGKRKLGYVWVPGHWDKKSIAKPKKVWAKGHWKKHKNRRIWVAGHWKR